MRLCSVSIGHQLTTLFTLPGLRTPRHHCWASTLRQGFCTPCCFLSPVSSAMRPTVASPLPQDTAASLPSEQHWREEGVCATSVSCLSRKEHVLLQLSSFLLPGMWISRCPMDQEVTLGIETTQQQSKNSLNPDIIPAWMAGLWTWT